jgi:two-component system chemotaxis response regulator CheB
MPSHDIIVIGASAGGVQAISALIAGLPRDLRAAVLVVLHLSKGRSVLPDILSRVGKLPAAHPRDGESLRYGRVYVAPPDRHMTVEGTHHRVVHGPTENGVRPAVDPLFRSAARAFGPRVIAIVLTGSLDDGTAGMAAVREAGGITIVQDPHEAFSPSMPRSAMEFVGVDHVLPLKEIPLLIESLTRERAASPSDHRGPHLDAIESDLAPESIAVYPEDRPGRVSVYSCPECHGTLWEIEEGNILRFRCRVGHAYSPDAMMAAQTDSVDRALWAALRALEERAALTRRLADRARQRRHTGVAHAFEQRAAATEEHVSVVKQILTSRGSGQAVPDHTEEAEPVPETAMADRFD